jgi:hypothetical protein
MPEEVTTNTEVKTASDGTVKISVEKYTELLAAAARKPPVINHKTVQKTSEMLAKESRLWGGGLMGLGASMFVVGGALYKSGLSS